MTQRPLYPADVKKTLQAYARNDPAYVRGKQGVTDKKQQGALIGYLNQALGDDERRRIALGWLFSEDGAEFEPMHSRDLTPLHWLGLNEWVGASRDAATNKWYPHPEFQPEALWVLNVALKAYKGFDVLGNAAKMGGEITGLVDVNAGLEDR